VFNEDGGKERLNCKICQRKAVTGRFCLIHHKAYKKLSEKHNFWRKALKISWGEYLNEIAINPFTGDWVKEVAFYLLDNEETANGKEA